MPTAFKEDFMPPAFNPERVNSPWLVSPPTIISGIQPKTP